MFCQTHSLAPKDVDGVCAQIWLRGQPREPKDRVVPQPRPVRVHCQVGVLVTFAPAEHDGEPLGFGSVTTFAECPPPEH